jgi:meiotic recombination protein SPO11
MDPPELLALDLCPPHQALRRIELVALHVLAHGQAEVAAPCTPVLAGGVLRKTLRRRVLTLQDAALVQALHLLSICHALLASGQTCTVREVYYRCKRADGALSSVEAFAHEAQCARAFELSCGLTRLTRCSLGVCGSDKGSFAGALEWRTRADEEWKCLSDGEHAAVPSVHAELQVRFAAARNRRARALLVVEKHTVFHRIAASELMQVLPCVVVTGRGFPDVATRRFVRIVADALNVPVLGLCDYNPFGLSILMTYAHGSLNMAESYHYVRCGASPAHALTCMQAVPQLRPVGLFWQDLAHIGLPEDVFQHFGEADERCAQALLNSPVMALRPDLSQELATMVRERRKLEIDALVGHRANFLCHEFLPTVMVRPDGRCV